LGKRDGKLAYSNSFHINANESLSTNVNGSNATNLINRRNKSFINQTINNDNNELIYEINLSNGSNVKNFTFIYYKINSVIDF
jgi:hypothetical protein